MISVKKSGKNIQPELRQKFVDGYQKPTGVQPNINRENVHTWARLDKRFMLYIIIHDITMALIPIIIFCEACVAHVCN